jgi:hypothetical protein
VGRLDDRADNEVTIQSALHWLRQAGPAVMQDALPSLCNQLEYGGLNATMLSSEDLAAISQAMKGQGSKSREFNKAYGQSLAIWGTPQAALAWAEGASAAERLEIRQTAFRQWASKEPNEARAAAKALPQGKEREEVIAAICDKMYENDAAADSQVIHWVRSLPVDDPARRVAFEKLAREWTSKAPAEVINFVQTATSGELTQQTLSAIGASISKEEDARKFLLALQENPGLPDGTKAAAIAAWKIVRADEDAARTFMHSLPSGPARTGMVKSLAHKYWQYDPEAAISFALTLPAKDREVVNQKLDEEGYPPDQAQEYAARIKGGK